MGQSVDCKKRKDDAAGRNEGGSNRHDAALAMEVSDASGDDTESTLHGPPLPPPKGPPQPASGAAAAIVALQEAGASVQTASGGGEQMTASANPAISEAIVECPSIGAQLVEAPRKAVCKAPGKLGGTDRFAAWTRSLSPAELDDISSSFVKWKEAELQ